MQLHDIVKPISDQTDEELLERLRTIRHNRTVVRPAAARHVKKAAKKGSQTRVTKVEAMVNDLTPDQIKALIAQLGEPK